MARDGTLVTYLEPVFIMAFAPDPALWRRVAVVVSILWIGLNIIASVLLDRYEWIYQNRMNANYGDIGPATVVAAVGAVLIFVACLAIPWIGRAAGKDKDAN